MDRRRFVALIGSALAVPLALAQQRAERARVAFLVPSSFSGYESRMNVFRAGLRDLGWIEGKNLLLEIRSVEGRYDRLPALADELATGKFNVLVTSGTPATLALKKATSSVPIVIAAISDPVASGIVPNLPRILLRADRVIE